MINELFYSLSTFLYHNLLYFMLKIINIKIAYLPSRYFSHKQLRTPHKIVKGHFFQIKTSLAPLDFL